VKDDKLYLIHITECIARIESYTALGRDAFLCSRMAQDAVVRNFEIMGEAAKRLSPSFRGEHSAVPWRRIAGFRDVLIHDYVGIDFDELWGIVENHLPGLKSQVEEILANLRSAPEN
jgi:uncharacterized protein with HEPN domain